MARKKKKMEWSAKSRYTVKEYLSLLGADGRQAEFILECISYGIMDASLVREIESGGIMSDRSSLELSVCMDFYDKLNPQIARILLGKFRSKQRKSICNTAGMSKIEVYVYNLLRNASEEGRRLRTEYILAMLKDYFAIDTSNRSTLTYYTGLINKVRRRLGNERYRKFQKL